MKKTFKAKRSCKQDVLVRVEFRFIRRQRDRLVGRDRAFRKALTILGRAVLLAAVIMAKRMLGL